jgi:hypothetical protein
MVWIVFAIVAIGLVVALVDRLTEAPIMRKRVNRGTDRYRASVNYVSSDEHGSISDIQIGSGRISDPMAKRLPIPPEPPDGQPK